MNKLLATCAVAALGVGTMYGTTALAQTATPMSSQNTMSSPSAQASATITAGQNVYDSSGSEVGAIKSVKTSVSGEQQAVVSVGKFLGIGGKDVEIPASQLTPRSQGGYTTTLTSAEIKKLPAAPESSTK